MRIFFLPLALLATATSGFAQNQQELRLFDQRLTAVETQVKQEKIYNSSARSETVKGYNLFLVGEYLYLMPEENGLEFAIKTNDPIFALAEDELHYKNLDFDYGKGFRVGAGFNIPHGFWDLSGFWMHYNTTTHGDASAGSLDGLVPIWSGLAPIPGASTFVHEAKARLRLNVNMVDVELGRDFFVGKWLSMRPSMGIRTGFIDQHYRLVYSPIIFPGSIVGVDDIVLKNEFWGVGPKAGLDTQWTLGGGFSIYASAAISLLFGEFEIRRDEEFQNLPQPTLKVHHDFHQVRAITDLALGIGWDLMLAHDQYHFGIRAGYEQHLYFGQNQFERVAYNVFNSNLISNLGDLSLQGWAGSLRVDF